MPISSQSPRGQPSQCPLCGEKAFLDVSPVTGDATCSACRQLLWEHRDLANGLREFFSKSLGVPASKITLDTPLGLDSLETVELIMELEDEFAANLDIPAEEAANEARQMRTLGDILRWLAKRRGDES